MKNLIHTIIYLSLLMLPLGTQAEIIMIEDALEAEIVSISIDASLNGYVVAKACPKCKDMRFKINKHTQAIKQGKTIHLHKANLLTGKAAVIIFDIKTKLSKQIIW